MNTSFAKWGCKCTESHTFRYFMRFRLQELAGKLSIFALTKIKQQIILAKKDESHERVLEWVEDCDCHAYRRYELPCIHMVPTDGTLISLDHIAPFWRIDNWDKSFFITFYLLIIIRTCLQYCRCTVNVLQSLHKQTYSYRDHFRIRIERVNFLLWTSEHAIDRERSLLKGNSPSRETRTI